MSNDKFWKFFFEIFEDLPRQGPGQRASTERALGFLPPLTSEHRLLDIGCGTGTQTFDLARACAARITAVDLHAPFLDQLATRAAEEGLGERVQTQVGDMGALDFPVASFDVLWSEGAVFIIGFAEGLRRWRPLLKPGGFLVVSDLCWLSAEPPEEMRDFLGEAADHVTDVAGRRAIAEGSGYRIVADFPLPAGGWRDGYYGPLARVCDAFEERHAGDEEASPSPPAAGTRSRSSSAIPRVGGTSSSC